MTDAPAAELTTVGPDFAVVHRGTTAERFDGLSPDTDHSLGGFDFRTLPEPGELLCRFATVNDVHFGEVECGVIEGLDLGPVLSRPPGAEPYPELMNRCAIAEIRAIEPEVLLVKGDLTNAGTVDEYERFLSFYEPAFGASLVHMRGNHESYHGGDLAAFPMQDVKLPGVHLAMIDTSVAARAGGAVSEEQLEWLESIAAGADRPVMLFGHHHVWSPDSNQRPSGYFGIEPGSSERLVDLVARHPSVVGYFAGHTHRNRVRTISATGTVPWVEVASVKDFPGSWAEYRVHDHGILQIHHRVSDPEALEWTEQTRQMFGGTYGGYAFGALHDRCFVIDVDRTTPR